MDWTSTQIESVRQAEIAQAARLTGRVHRRLWLRAEAEGWAIHFLMLRERVFDTVKRRQFRDRLAAPAGQPFAGTNWYGAGFGRDALGMKWAADGDCTQCGEPILWGRQCGRCRLNNALATLVRRGESDEVAAAALDRLVERYGLCDCLEVQARGDRCRCGSPAPGVYQGRRG